MTHEFRFAVARFLLLTSLVFPAGCQQRIDVEIARHEIVEYEASYTFPSNLTYVEPELGERAVLFEVKSGDDLLRRERVLDLNGYYVQLLRCDSPPGESSGSIMVMGKPAGPDSGIWMFLVSRHHMERLTAERPALAGVPEDEVFCFQISAGSMTGASVQSDRIPISASAIRAMQSLLDE